MGRTASSGFSLASLADKVAAVEAVNAATILPLSALPFPSVATSDNKIVVTPAAATNGGTVSVSAGGRVALGVEVLTGETGRMCGFTVPAFTSGDLDVSSTCFLRARASGGVLALYVQKGTDDDPVPAGLVGTPGGASGGGFDSTVLDMLIAKIETGAAGSVPVVTALRNKDRLHFSSQVQRSVTTGSSGGETDGTTYTLDWARAPVQTMGSVGFDDTVEQTYHVPDRLHGSFTIQTRYELRWVISIDLDISEVKTLDLYHNVTATA